ncbi:MAG: ATP-binding protein [Desulfobacula sp.]|nr:ATP-binding protein [Desulfobacula sp.]
MDFKPIHLCVTSHPENLKQIRNMMNDITTLLDLSKEDASSLILAVDEVCSNIMRHGYNNDHTREISLTITPEQKQLSIRIVDDGLSFDMNTAVPRDPDDVKPGGLGIFIVKQVMDRVEYDTTDEGRNTIKLVKKL